jgi:hypothetical protein
MKRFLAAVLIAISLTACGKPQTQATYPQESTDKFAEAKPKPTKPKQPTPTEFAGNWKLVKQECEPDYPDGPETNLPEMSIRFDPDFRYEALVEGWRFVGVYEVGRMQGSPPSAVLGATLYKFDFVKGRLENWSEGEAVYPCANIFEREKD